MEALLDANADVDLRDVNGKTPLQLAAARGYENVVQKLLPASIDRGSVCVGDACAHSSTSDSLSSVHKLFNTTSKHTTPLKF